LHQACSGWLCARQICPSERFRLSVFFSHFAPVASRLKASASRETLISARFVVSPSSFSLQFEASLPARSRPPPSAVFSIVRALLKVLPSVTMRISFFSEILLLLVFQSPFDCSHCEWIFVGTRFVSNRPPFILVLFSFFFFDGPLVFFCAFLPEVPLRAPLLRIGPIPEDLRCDLQVSPPYGLWQISVGFPPSSPTGPFSFSHFCSPLHSVDVTGHF